MSKCHSKCSSIQGVMPLYLSPTKSVVTQITTVASRSSEAIGLSTPERPLAILTCMRYTDGARNDTHPGFQLCKNHVAFANEKDPSSLSLLCRDPRFNQ